MNNSSYDPWDDIELSPEQTIDIYKNKPEKDAWDELDFDESFWKNTFRTALQIPQGVAEGTGPGIAAGLWSLISQGEIFDPEALDQIREISQREGIPFDEDAYMEAAKNALGTIPTVHNIGSALEESTGLPLDPKTKLQKLTRLGSTAGKFQPGTVGEKATAAATAPATSALLQETGVPEPFADIAGLGIGTATGSKGPKIDISTKKKPSGLTERQFEDIKKPKEVSESKLNKINEKLESDFKEVSDKIIKESPVGETAENLKNDPTFKQESRELLNEAQRIADSLPGTVSSTGIKKDMADLSAKSTKGFVENEYDKSYKKFVKENIKGISKNPTHGELVRQYRKNNESLSEYFEPGSSKALNRAKRDSILDFNRSIANVIEKTDPKLSEVFKEGNARWTKIMDAEAVDGFVNELFSGKIDYKKMHEFYDKTGYDRIFKRSLGEKGYNQFDQLMQDMLSSEAPYKMLKVAKSKGFDDLAKTGAAFILHPKVGYAKLTYNLGKEAYKGLINSLLDKPKLALTWKKGVEDLKKGNFKSAEKEFKSLENEVKDFDIRDQGRKEALKKFNEKTSEKSSDISVMKKASQNSKISEAKVEKPINNLKTEKKSIKNQIIKNLESSIDSFKNDINILEEFKKKQPENKSIHEQIKNFSGRLKKEKERLEETKKMNEEDFYSKPSNEKTTEKSSITNEQESIKIGKPENQKSYDIARESFKNVLEGKKVSDSQKKSLKDVQVSLLETRGQGKQFHGTGKPINKLSSDIYGTSSEQNIFGPGFYTTDALDIADGYSKAKFSKQPTVYSVKEKTPQKIYDAEKPIEEFKDLWLRKEKKHFDSMQQRSNESKDAYFKKYKGSFEKYLETSTEYLPNDVLLNEKPKSLRDFYDKIKERAIDENLKAYEVQDYFDSIQSILEKEGFEGISHKGGILTKNPEHKVKIYWKPENLEIQEFSYPKQFKKINNLKPK